MNRYIAWLRQAYPSAERAGLLQVLERATHAFRDDPRYVNSPAYVALWAEYVRMAVPPLLDCARSTHATRRPFAG